MDHPGISLYYISSDGREWASYIQEKLGSAEYSITTELNEFTGDTAFHTRSSKANLFLISPDILTLQSSEWQLLKDFDSNTSMAILVGIDYADLVLACEQFRVSNVLQWLSSEIEETEDSVRDMLICIISIYEGHGVNYRDSVVENDPLVSTRPRGTSFADEIPEYVVLPLERPRQVNHLRNVFQEGDDVLLLLERRAEGALEVAFDDQVGLVYPELLTDMTVYHMPKHTCHGTFSVTLDDIEIGTGQIEDEHSHTYSTSEDEEYTQFSRKTTLKESQTLSSPSSTSGSPRPCSMATLPGSHTSSTDTAVTSRKKLDIIRELLESETDPENTLCDCLGIERGSRGLDATMTSMVEYTKTLKHISLSKTAETSPEQSDAIWPTLLHFGAQYNLHSFCEALLSNHMMHGYCVTPNKNGDLPHDIARKAGHTKLAELLTSFAGYVRSDKHDSGFSSEMPHLSTIALLDDLNEYAPPRPHSDASDTSDGLFNGYLDMAPTILELSSPPGEVNGRNGDKPSPKPMLIAARDEADFGLGHSLDEFLDDTFITPTNMEPPTELKGLHYTEEPIYYNQGIAYDGEDPPFPDILDMRTSHFYVEDPRTPSAAELSKSTPRSFPSYNHEQASISRSRTHPVFGSTDSTNLTYRHKNINTFMGMDDTLHRSRTSPVANSCVIETKSQRSGLTSKIKNTLWKKKKTVRSHSEPTITEENLAAINKQQNAKIYRKSPSRSQRTSDASSSSNSTYSEKTSSALIADEGEIQIRGKAEKKKNKTRMKFFKSDTEKRRSVRITKVLEDHNLTGPSLPPRRDERF